MVAPLKRFERPAAQAPEPVAPLEGAAEEPELRPLTRLVSASGKISFEAASYHVGAWLAGEAVALTLRDGLLEDFRRPRRARRPATCTATSPRQDPARPAPHGPGRAPCRRSLRARR